LESELLALGLRRKEGGRNWTSHSLRTLGRPHRFFGGERLGKVPKKAPDRPLFHAFPRNYHHFLGQKMILSPQWHIFCWNVTCWFKQRLNEFAFLSSSSLPPPISSCVYSKAMPLDTSISCIRIVSAATVTILYPSC
jgi:hypothetical protein